MVLDYEHATGPTHEHRVTGGHAHPVDSRDQTTHAGDRRQSPSHGFRPANGLFGSGAPVDPGNLCGLEANRRARRNGSSLVNWAVGGISAASVNGVDERHQIGRPAVREPSAGFWQSARHQRPVCATEQGPHPGYRERGHQDRTRRARTATVDSVPSPFSATRVLAEQQPRTCSSKRRECTRRVKSRRHGHALRVSIRSTRLRAGRSDND